MLDTNPGIVIEKGPITLAKTVLLVGGVRSDSDNYPAAKSPNLSEIS
jgi:hypothetical protein